MKLVIDREKWLRGYSLNSYLLFNGKMCCLGFYAKACGYSDDEIEGIANPFQVSNTNKFDKWLFEDRETGDEPFHSHDTNKLIDANDNFTNEKLREEMISIIFGRHGIEVEFVG